MNRTSNFLRQTARIAGILVFMGCAFFLYTVIHYTVTEHESPLPQEVKTTIYPAVLLMMGALVAWKWPAIGGLLLLSGFTLLIVLRGWPTLGRTPRDLGEWLMLAYVILLPVTGLLHLLAWLLNRRSTRRLAHA